MTRAIEAVLFDLDGTLVEYERPSSEVLDAAFERAGVDPFFEIGAYYEQYFEQLAGDHDDLREHCFEVIAADRGRDPEVGRRVAAAYAKERSPDAVRLLDGAQEAIERFAADHAIGLVTNGPPYHQRPKIDATGFADAFESVVYAGHDTAPKPDPEPFERALGDLGVTSDRAVYVGNSLAADVAGAAAAGLRSVWLDDGTDPDPVPDYVVGSLADLRRPPWE